MKNAIILITILILTIWGCADNNSLTGPADQTNSSVTQGVTAELNYFKLPKFISKGLSKGGTGFSVTKLVKAKKNTKMEIKDDYNGPNGKVKVSIKIDFKKGTVKEDTEITMSFDPVYGIIEFSPHMIFNKDARLELAYDGLDPDEMAEVEPDLDFIYLAPDGTYEKIDKTKIKIKAKKGEIKLIHGKLPHFSRYAFVH